MTANRPNRYNAARDAHAAAIRAGNRKPAARRASLPLSRVLRWMAAAVAVAAVASYAVPFVSSFL